MSVYNHQLRLIKKASDHGYHLFSDEPSGESEAVRLHAALNRSVCDIATVIDVLVSYRHKQNSLVRHYKSLYGQDLSTDMRRVLAGKLEMYCQKLIQPVDHYLAKELHRVLQRLPFADTVAVTAILCERTSKDLKAIKKTYSTLFGHSVEEDMQTCMERDCWRIMRLMVDCNREQGGLDHININNDAQMLVKLGVSVRFSGGSVPVIMALLKRRSYQHLRYVFRQFTQLTNGCTVEQDLDKETRPHLRKSLKILVSAIEDPHKFCAMYLYRTGKHKEEQEKVLITLHVTRSKEFFSSMEQKHRQMYGQKFTQIISNQSYGDYKSLLIKIIGIHV